MQAFDVPAGIGKLGSQVVQKLRMRGPGAHHAEVTRRSDDALAEMIMPDAVHHYPSRQRVLGAGDPVGQCRPATRGSVSGHRNDTRISRFDDRQEAGLYLFERRVPGTNIQTVRGRSLRA